MTIYRMVSTLLVWVLLVGSAAVAVADPPYFTPQRDPGAINRREQQMIWMQEETPWMFDGKYDPAEDDSNPFDTVIEFHNMDVEAKIVPSRPRTEPPVVEFQAESAP